MYKSRWRFALEAFIVFLAIIFKPHSVFIQKHYDQGSLGEATENGRIEAKDGGFQFISTSGGGTYDIQSDGNSLVLEGNNWRCELEKN